MTTETSLVINYLSNIAKGIGKDATAMTRGTNRMVGGLNRVRRSADLLDSKMGFVANRFTALGGGVAGGLFLRQSLNISHRLRLIATQLNLTDEQLKKYQSTLHEAAISSKVDAEKLLGALEIVADKAPEKLNEGVVKFLSETMAVTGLSGDVVGSLYAGLTRNFNLSAEEVRAILDIAKDMAIAFGSVWVLLKLIRGGFAAGEFLSRRSINNNAGVGGQYGAGVMPVYVVNMGASGNGFAGGGGGDRKNAPNKGRGKFSNFGRAGFAGALLGGGLHLANNGVPDNFTEGGAFAGSLGGGVAGAIAGAAAGSVIPVVGTAIGAVLGGLLGSFAGENLGEALGGVIDINITSDGKAEVVGAEVRGNGTLNIDTGDNFLNASP